MEVALATRECQIRQSSDKMTQVRYRRLPSTAETRVVGEGGDEGRAWLGTCLSCLRVRVVSILRLLLVPCLGLVNVSCLRLMHVSLSSTVFPFFARTLCSNSVAWTSALAVVSKQGLQPCHKPQDVARLCPRPPLPTSPRLRSRTRISSAGPCSSRWRRSIARQDSRRRRTSGHETRAARGRPGAPEQEWQLEPKWLRATTTTTTTTTTYYFKLRKLFLLH